MNSVFVERGFYTCVRCGQHMITAIVANDRGRLVLKMEPLYCPECANEKDRRDAWRRLRTLKREYS